MNEKKLIAFGVMGVLAMIFVTAAVIPYFGQVQRDVTVTPAVLINGVSASVFTSGPLTLDGGESVTSDDLNVESQTSVNVPLSIVTTSDSVDTENIVSTINYLLDVESVDSGTPAGTSSRITILASDVDGLTTLNDLESMSWDVNVISGYLPHVDVFLGNGETLIFEGAKSTANGTFCDVIPYPNGELSTFGVDRGEEINGDTFAWENGPIPGPCGNVGFEAIHKTLTEWKTSYGDVEVLRFEIEIDSWIPAYSDVSHDSDVKNIQINEVIIDDKVTLLPEEELTFNVETEFATNIVPGLYTITTTVNPRA